MPGRWVGGKGSIASPVKDLIAILEAMRDPQGRKITDAQWKKLLQTEVDLSHPDFDAASLVKDTADWYHTAYTWNFVSMAMALRAQHGAREQNKQLFYIPSVDSPKKNYNQALYKEMLDEYNLRKTKKSRNLLNICGDENSFHYFGPPTIRCARLHRHSGGTRSGQRECQACLRVAK